MRNPTKREVPERVGEGWCVQWGDKALTKAHKALFLKHEDL
jgi:hypothetical protein